MTDKGANTIGWHEDKLFRYRESVERKRQELVRCKHELTRMEEELKFYTLQIEEAKKMKKEKFDRYNFLKKRSPTYGLH